MVLLGRRRKEYPRQSLDNARGKPWLPFIVFMSLPLLRRTLMTIPLPISAESLCVPEGTGRVAYNLINRPVKDVGKTANH
jgi:hypothetical protein